MIALILFICMVVSGLYFMYEPKLDKIKGTKILWYNNLVSGNRDYIILSIKKK